MNERARKAVILLPILVTLVLAAVIGGLIIVQEQRQAAQVDEAETVAQNYLSDVETFRSTVVKQIAAGTDVDPARLRKIVDRAASSPPTLPDAPAYGQDNSAAYATAVRAQQSLLTPYRRLSSALKRADMAQDFIAAAQKVLELRASDYIGFGFITSSGPVRTRLIPAFVEARDSFNGTDVPKGQQKLAATVSSAAQYVIDQATLLADRLDARQNFSFTYTEQFQKAADAVNDYSTVVKGDVAEAINAVTATD